MNELPSEQSEITTLSDYDVVWYDNDNSLQLSHFQNFCFQIFSHGCHGRLCSRSCCRFYHR